MYWSTRNRMVERLHSYFILICDKAIFNTFGSLRGFSHVIMEVDCMEHSPQFSLNFGSYILLEIGALGNIFSFFVIQHVTGHQTLRHTFVRTMLAALWMWLRAGLMKQLASFLFCGVPHFLVTSLLADRPKNDYIWIKLSHLPAKKEGSEVFHQASSRPHSKCSKHGSQKDAPQGLLTCLQSYDPELSERSYL